MRLSFLTQESTKALSSFFRNLGKSRSRTYIHAWGGLVFNCSYRSTVCALVFERGYFSGDFFRSHRNTPHKIWARGFCGRIFVLRSVRRTRVRRGAKTEIEKDFQSNGGKQSFPTLVPSQIRILSCGGANQLQNLYPFRSRQKIPLKSKMLVEGTRDNLVLLLLRKLYKVYRITGNTHR